MTRDNEDRTRDRNLEKAARLLRRDGPYASIRSAAWVMREDHRQGMGASILADITPKGQEVREWTP